MVKVIKSEYEQDKLNEQYHHAKFDIYHIYDVKNSTMFMFLTYLDTNDQKHVNHLSWMQTKSHTMYVVHDLLNVFSNNKTFKQRRTRI